MENRGEDRNCKRSIARPLVLENVPLITRKPSANQWVVSGQWLARINNHWATW